MFEHGVVRYGLLKFMYVLTILVAGGFGLIMLLSPSTVDSLMGIPTDNPIIYGVAASVFLAFALLAVLGFRAPLKFVPVLVLQLVYKVAWMVAVALPAYIRGDFPSWAVTMFVIFLVFIVGDIIAIPFWTLFEREAVTKEKKKATKAVH